MDIDNSKILRMVLIPAIIIAIAIFPVVIAIASASGSGIAVTCTLSTNTPAPGSTFHVFINISGLRVGGIVETIPEGFTFVSTTHPSNQTYVSGQKVVFVVLNETSIRYEVRAPSQGTGTFSGTWYDALSEKEGIIKSMSVSVRVVETPMSGPTPTPTTTPALTPSPSPSPSPPAQVPAFEAVYALAGLLVVAVAVSVSVLFRRGGGDSRE